MVDTKQGIVIDLHERDDVQHARAEYVQRVQNELANGAILVFQDESCFNSHDRTSKVWAEKGTQRVKTKGKDRGKSIMVSLFATRENGIVDEATLFLDIGRDGYFNTQPFLDQEISVCFSALIVL